jgi:MOSC domain-containing protein YiiM
MKDPLNIQVVGLYISPAHNFFGHHGKPPGENPAVEVGDVECVAGRGVCGDRFFDYRPGYEGQITFFSAEVFEELCRELNLSDKSPQATRRNVITRGTDLNALIGKEFEVQGVAFIGISECRPCYWMDQALAPGAEAALRGRGGLRAQILTTGRLRVDTA